MRENISNGPVAWQPLTTWRLRIGAALQSRDLIGPHSRQTRYLRFRWWVTFWRLSTLLIIPVIAIISPGYFESLPRALALMGAAFGFTVAEALAVRRIGLRAKWPVWILDLAFSLMLILMSGNTGLLAIFSWYSVASAIPGLEDALLAGIGIGLLGGGALLSESAAGYGLAGIINSHAQLCIFTCLSSWVGGFSVYSVYFRRIGTLKLDKHLEEERRDYRRRLHDDLGNTLCGLHYKIRGLAAVRNVPEQAEAFRYLESGYSSANDVLARLVKGLDNPIESDEVNRSLLRLKRELESLFNVEVRLFMPEKSPRLSIEVQREALAVVREAVANAVEHAGALQVTVTAAQKRGMVRLTVANAGQAFTREELRARQAEGGLGVRNMRERARRIRARLKIDSRPGSGTRLTLAMRAATNSKTINGKLQNNPQIESRVIYKLLRLLKTGSIFYVVAMTALLPASVRTSWPVLAITGVFVLDSLIWLAFMGGIGSLLARHPRAIFAEYAMFGAMFIFSLQAGTVPYFCCYLGMAVACNAGFLTYKDVLPAVAMLDAAIIIAYLAAPAAATMGSMAMTHELMLGEALFYCMMFLTMAFTACLGGELLDGIEELQREAIGRELAREKERLSAHTHTQLHGVVERLGEDIRDVLARHRERLVDAGTVKRLSARSTELKQKLRAILRELDDYSCCPFPQDIRGPLPDFECFSDPARPIPALVDKIPN